MFDEVSVPNIMPVSKLHASWREMWISGWFSSFEFHWGNQLQCRTGLKSYWVKLWQENGEFLWILRFRIIPIFKSQSWYYFSYFRGCFVRTKITTGKNWLLWTTNIFNLHRKILLLLIDGGSGISKGLWKENSCREARMENLEIFQEYDHASERLFSLFRGCCSIPRVLIF